MRYFSIAILTLLTASSVRAAEPVHDLVIYGGTSAGVAAAVQARKMGKSVVLIEPTNRLGGLTTGGLGQTDIGNKAAIGGLGREFYQAIRTHYNDPAAWKWQPRDQYMDSGQTRTATGEDAMWTFEPGVALKIYQAWVKDHGVEVVYSERLDRESGVATTRSIPWRIVAIRMESGRTFRGKMFIDATYEGDLMVVGQSAATAAVHAIEENVPVQKVDFAKLRERLLADKQVLEWTGEYEVRLGYPANPNRATNVPVVIDAVQIVPAED